VGGEGGEKWRELSVKMRMAGVAVSMNFKEAYEAVSSTPLEYADGF
jgi:hypothetical protein